MDLVVTGVVSKDIRFPTSLEKHGSDAMVCPSILELINFTVMLQHPDPDYSCAYVILQTDDPKLEGHGLTFTIGRGTEIVCAGIRALEYMVIGKKLKDIFDDFASFWRMITSDR